MNLMNSQLIYLFIYFLIPLFHHLYVWTPDLTEILKKKKKNLVADDAVERGETTRCV